jgi:hypothetical protein
MDFSSLYGLDNIVRVNKMVVNSSIMYCCKNEVVFCEERDLARREGESGDEL